jgi:hypothetical protein
MRERLLMALVVFAGCNGNGSGAMDMTPAPDLSPAPDLIDGEPSDMFPSVQINAPQVVNQGGPVLDAPVIVPVFFSNDDATQRASIEDFLSKVGATNYWKAATQEYGVSAATATKPVELTETATGTIADATIQTWLAGKLNGNDPAFPKPTGAEIYAINYPAGVTITLPAGSGSSNSCTSFGGYHDNITLDAAHLNMNVAYAVIPRCGGSLGMDTMQTTTSAESHELIEASTDPFPNMNPAYARVDDNHRYWSRVLGGGEVGDLCAQDASSFHTFAELPYMVQRTWSNASAKSGHDPCVPTLTQAYFNVMPEMPDTITYGSMTMVMAQGVRVPLGMTKTIALDLFSDGDTGGPWTVKVEDAAQLLGGTSSFTFALDHNTGQNGEKIQLSITTNTMSTRGTGTFAVISKSAAGQTHVWFGLVGEN